MVNIKQDQGPGKEKQKGTRPPGGSAREGYHTGEGNTRHPKKPGGKAGWWESLFKNFRSCSGV